MVREMKVFFSKNTCVIKIIANGNGTKLSNQSTLEVPKLKRSQLVNFREKNQKILTVIFLIVLYSHEPFELQSAHLTFFRNTALLC